VKNLWLASGIFLVCWSLLKGCIGTLAPDVDDVSEVLWKKKDENDRPYYVIDRYGDSRVRIPTLLVFTKRWVGIGACMIVLVTCFASGKAFHAFSDYEDALIKTGPPFASPFFTDARIDDSRHACTVLHDAKLVPGSGLALVIVETRADNGDQRHEGLFVSVEKQMRKGEVHRCKYIEHFDLKEAFFTNEPPYQSIQLRTTIVLDE